MSISHRFAPGGSPPFICRFPFTYREMTKREIRSVSDLKMQGELRESAYQSATMLISKDG